MRRQGLADTDAANKTGDDALFNSELGGTTRAS